MQEDELRELAAKISKQKCETQSVEVKAAHDGCPKRLYDTLSSFSNQDGGGVIVFGIDEKQGFAAAGVYNAQDLMQKVTEQCKQMEPVVRPLFTTCSLCENVLVSAEIPGVNIMQRPVFYRGSGKVKGSFVRVGDADEPMTDYEIYSYEAYRRRLNDDIRVAEAASEAEFDKNALGKYLLLVKSGKPNLAQLEDADILRLMGIMKDGKPTLAGVLCFYKYPQAVYPQLCVTAVVVPGTQMGETGEDGERFRDNRRIEGTVEQMIEETMLFVKRNMRVRTIIDKDGKRADKEEYPLKAIREAVINAIMHRDYSIHTEGAPVRLLMFSDRLEIINEGGLYGSLTLDQLGKDQADTRNQKLANIMEVLKLAENRYSGIPTIRMEMEKYKLPEPVFASARGRFSVTLMNALKAADDKAQRPERDLVSFCRTPRSRAEIAEYLGVSSFYAMKKYVRPLLTSGKILMTLPEKPRSGNQRFYTNPQN